ncbi:hypothetical protein [Rhodococcus sp. YH1]|uniref:hypothetical protein n=1 Tax=Rhodococcus sp. YH1 TaxID=89066 RepID=UPI001386A829|nr:hypothetical protein [Rhodococcus sp. YH1]
MTTPSQPRWPNPGSDGRLKEKHLPAHLGQTNLNATYGLQAKTTGPVQDALDAGAVGGLPVFVTPGTHTVTRTTSGDRRALASAAGTRISGLGTSSIVRLDTSEAPQASLSHFLLLGSTVDGVSDVTVEKIRAEINQRQINRWSRIVSRQVASDNSYCTVFTLGDHYLTVGDSIEIANAELAALNGIKTVSEVLTPKSFRVTGASSSNKAVVTQGYDATVRLVGATGSIDGITSIPNSLSTKASENIFVRDCIINGTSNAVRATIIRAAESGVFHRNWLVQNCRGRDFSNKVVEYGFVDGGKVIDSQFSGCADGLQAIFWSRNIEFRGNRIGYYLSGINVTSGSHDVDIVNNLVEAEADAPKLLRGAALLLRTENTSGENYVSYNVRSRGNIYRNTVTDSRDVLAFSTLSAVASSEFRDLSFDHDTFDGAVRLYEQVTPAKTTIRGVRFTACRIKTLVTVPYATSKVYDVVFRDCDFTDDVTVNASDVQFIDCRFAGGVTISADASDIVMRGCTSATAIVNNGTGAVLEGNRVRPTYPRP